MKLYYEKLCIFITLFFIGVANLTAQQTRPPGIDSVVVIFKNPPVVTLQKAPLKYNKAFAMSFQMDDALSDIYKKVYPVFHGDGIVPGLTFTDGCGHTITFKMSSAIYIFSSNNNTDILNPDDPYHDASKLTWPQLDTLYRNHWGIENHGLFDNPDLSSPEKIEYAFQRTESYSRRKISDSVAFKSFVIPNGDETYISYLSRNHYHAAINQGHDASWIGYGELGFNVGDDTINWLKPTKLNRLFLYSDFKKSADTLYAHSRRSVHEWLLSGMHTLPGNFIAEMEEIYNTYGKPGLDNILLAPDDEILDYFAVKQAIQLHKTMKGNRMTITFSGNIPTDRLFYALSLNVFADQLIDSVSVFGTRTYAYSGVGKDTALINISWDGRYYPAPEMLADSFTRQAMATGSEWKALVAMDYVKLLPLGTTKIRLQDSLCSLDQSGWSVKYDDGFCNLVHLGPDTTLCPGDNLILSGPENMSVYTWYQNGTVFSTAPEVTVVPDTATTFVLKVKDLSGNEMSDTLNVSLFSVPKVKLGADTGICAGSFLSFSAPAGDYSYRWNNGDTTASITIYPFSDTLVFLTVTTPQSCTTSDSVLVFYHLSPVVSIPQDSTSYCFGDSVLLTANSKDLELSFQWNTGDTSSSIIFLPAIPDTTYQFSVTATSSAGCITKDTAHLFVLPQIPGFRIGTDTSLCAGSSVSLKAPSGYYTYHWSTGDTASSITIFPVSDTTVSLTIYTPELCPASDSVKITYNLPPVITIPQDSSTYCFGDSIFLTAAAEGSGISYQWDTGDTTDTIVVKPLTPDTTFVYSVKALSSEGCVTQDTAHIFILPAVAVKMDADSLKTCDNQSITVSSTPLQGDFISYTWIFDRDTAVTETPFFSVNKPAVSNWIRVKAANLSGCFATDSTYLNTITYPKIIIPGDTGVCSGDSLHLLGRGGSLFYWLHGVDTLSSDSVLNVVPSQETTYYAISGFDSLCMSRDSLTASLIPLPKTRISRSNAPVCMNTSLTLTATGADRYLWLPGNVTGDTFFIKPVDTLAVYLTGTSTGGCVATDSLTLSPAPLPETRFSGLMLSYCENDPVVTLHGEPQGGIFSGSGMNANIFSPDLAGPGDHAISYIYTSPDGCAGKTEKKVFVYGPVPVIHLQPEDTTLRPDGFVRYNAGPGFDDYYWNTGNITQKIKVNYGDFPIGTHIIRVVGVIGGCSSVDSAIVTFANPTGIFNPRIAPLKIYPNPTHKMVALSFHGNGKPFRLEIFDARGKRIFVKQQEACLGNCSSKFDISSLKSGIYYVWLHNETASYFSKLIVQ